MSTKWRLSLSGYNCLRLYLYLNECFVVCWATFETTWVVPKYTAVTFRSIEKINSLLENPVLKHQAVVLIFKNSVSSQGFSPIIFSVFPVASTARRCELHQSSESPLWRWLRLSSPTASSLAAWLLQHIAGCMSGGWEGQGVLRTAHRGQESCHPFDSEQQLWQHSLWQYSIRHCNFCKFMKWALAYK